MPLAAHEVRPKLIIGSAVLIVNLAKIQLLVAHSPRWPAAPRNCPRPNPGFATRHSTQSELEYPLVDPISRRLFLTSPATALVAAGATPRVACILNVWFPVV